MTQWTDPITWVTGTLVGTAQMNTQIRDNPDVLNLYVGLPDGTLRNFTAGGLLLGNGTGTFQVTAALTTGQLIVGSGFSTLAVGADDTYFIADSGESQGVRWGSPTVLGSVEDIIKFS